MAYSTATQVKDKDLSRLVLQAQWADADVDARILEGDSIINGYLAQMGYALPFASTPALVNQMSILYGKYACLRDIHHHFSPSANGASGYKAYKDQFDALMESLRTGEIGLVDATPALIAPTVPRVDQDVSINTIGVQRALTMGDPESETMDGVGYSDPDVTGDPE